jgi:hypothetical protein
MGAVFAAFFVIGVALPVLPLHVHQRLGLSAFIVGLVAGTQFGSPLPTPDQVERRRPLWRQGRIVPLIGLFRLGTHTQHSRFTGTA